MEKYSLVQRLGQGSFAVVWKARRKSDGRLVAVKQLKQSPESWDACKQLPEVRAASAIADRRHVIHLLEAVRHGGELFLVYELLCESLHRCATQSRKTEEPQVRWAGRRLLAALAAVHAAGLVHCDVKPENILLGSDGGACGEPTLKLCDFGQATVPEAIGTYVGTRWYRAPELLLGARGDSAVDLWSAGCTLAELFLRRPLVPGTDNRDMLFRICGEIGAPDDDCGWQLAPRMIEASGRPNASAAAWEALAAAGASENAVSMLTGLLRYDSSRRSKADRALREPFFSLGATEFPMDLPPPRPVSPETRRRQRDEATTVEKKLHAKGNAGAFNRGGSPVAAERGGWNLRGNYGETYGEIVEPVGGGRWAQPRPLPAEDEPQPSAPSAQRRANQWLEQDEPQPSAPSAQRRANQWLEPDEPQPSAPSAQRRAAPQRRAEPSVTMDAAPDIDQSRLTASPAAPGMRRGLGGAQARSQRTLRPLGAGSIDNGPTAPQDFMSASRLINRGSNDSLGTPSGGAAAIVGGSDDEALADMFWNSCKTGGATPSQPRRAAATDKPDDASLENLSRSSSRGDPEQEARISTPDAPAVAVDPGFPAEFTKSGFTPEFQPEVVATRTRPRRPRGTDGEASVNPDASLLSAEPPAAETTGSPVAAPSRRTANRREPRKREQPAADNVEDDNLEDDEVLAERIWTFDRGLARPGGRDRLAGAHAVDHGESNVPSHHRGVCGLGAGL